MTKNTNFKFGMNAPMDNFEKGTWLGSRDPINFWALNGNSSKMAKDTNF